ncbi:MAG: hypothetical protein WCW84_00250 [Sulfurimonas sp.]|jgi:hypothetical protein
MTTTLSIRDLARNTNILQQYDYVDIEDKKSHEYKGLFISPKYADEFRKLLEKKIMDERQRDLDEILQFVGSGSIDEKYMNMTSRELREARALRL